MKKLKLFLLLAVVTGTVMMIGCKKGDTGPVGPAGPDSVKYSGWAPLSMSFAGFDGNNDSVFTQSIAASSITSSILASGSVIGYVLLPDPITGDSSAVNAINYVLEYYNVGSIDLVSYGVDLSGLEYRYVVIPSKIAVTDATGSIQTYTRDQLKGMSYSALTKVLNIPAR